MCAESACLITTKNQPHQTHMKDRNIQDSSQVNNQNQDSVRDTTSSNTSSNQDSPDEVKDFLTNLFNPIYKSSDNRISDRPEIQDTHDYVLSLAEEIKGNYDLDYRIINILRNSYGYIRKGSDFQKMKVLGIHTDRGLQFKAFCQEVLGYCYSTVNNTIKAAEIAIKLMKAGFDYLPQNASQALALEGITEQELIESWEKVIQFLPKYQITAKSIKELLGLESGIKKTEDTRVNLKLDTLLFLKELANENNTSVSNIIDELIRFIIYFLRPEKLPDVKASDLEKWEEDLRNLVDEYDQRGDDFLNTE